MNIDKVKKYAYLFWALCVVVSFVYFITHPNQFTAESLALFMERFKGQIWFVYIAVSFIRGFFLIPSTPFVLTGIVLFPNEPLLVLFVSMSGVVFSATLLYFFSDLLGFSDYLEKKYL